MTHLSGDERSRYVSKMFGRISGTYDRLNRLMTFGQDLKWRRQAVELLKDQNPGVILDLGAGTGDLTIEIHRQYPAAFVIGLDLSPEMIQLARTRNMHTKVCWVIADVNDLPFPPNTFAATISGFLMRNLPDLGPALIEQHRVLLGKGKFVCLETSPVKDGFLKRVIDFYIQHVIPLIGKMVSKDPAAYDYLAVSTKQFLTADEFLQRIELAGFTAVGYLHRMLGTVAIFSALKG